MKIRLMLFLAIIYLLFLKVFLNLTNATPSFVGYGSAISESETYHVVSPEDGVISKIVVKDGQKIKAGQPLLIINTDKIVKLANNQYSKFEKSFITLPPVPDLRKVSFLNRKYMISSRGENDFSQRESSINYDELFKEGVISRKELENFKQKRENSEKINDNSKIVQIEQKIQEYPARQVLLKKVHSGNISQEIVQAPQPIFKKRVITSPVDGIVKIQEDYTQGDNIKAGETIMSIYPKNAKILAEVSVKDTKSVSFIYLNKIVIITTHGFPSGKLYGTVQSVDIKTDKAGKGDTYIVLLNLNMLYLKIWTH